jgi:spore coat protein U-like protein
MRHCIGTALIALAFSASADQANMDVGAEIIGKCQIEAVTPIDFGDLEQTAGNSADRVAVGGLNYWCSLGMRYNISMDDGLNSSKGSRRMRGQAATNSLEYLTYELRPRRGESGSGLGPQFPEVFDMEATVKGRDYEILSVGGLLDSVVVTISP